MELTAAEAKRACVLLSDPVLGISGRPFGDLDTELALPSDTMAELLLAGLVVV
ncbi:MAG: hypothetical protein NT061_12240 [Spirochaetes bacterium]|nr:hypothetical protein [Spirochaetota bacterium]